MFQVCLHWCLPTQSLRQLPSTAQIEKTEDKERERDLDATKQSKRSEYWKQRHWMISKLAPLIGFGRCAVKKTASVWGLQADEALELNAWRWQRVRAIRDQVQLPRQSSSTLNTSVSICQGLLMQCHLCLSVSSHINQLTELLSSLLLNC